MGVAAIWDFIKPGFDQRVPFSLFVTRFYQENRRPVRIAIDAFQWIFECRVNQVTAQGPEFTARLLQNMHARIRTLISLNVSFVLVFDGHYKPNFKRNPEAQSKQLISLENRDFEKDYLQNKASIDNDDYKRRDLPDIRELKKELERWNISYVEAPAEGEAEAAKLQSLGVVDYVLSNDTDTMIYGATKILRNFSKLEEDKPAGAASDKTQTTTEYWVTPVDLATVLKETGYDEKRIMLLSILAGADYNSGVHKIGIEKASQLALSSTEKIKRHVPTCPYSDFRDFSYELHEIYKGSLTSTERKDRYLKFQKTMFEEVSDNLIEYFGRREKALVSEKEFKGFPPDYVVMLYYYPLLCTKDFKFEDGKTNFAETTDATKWLSTPDFDASFRYYQSNPPPNVSKVGTWFSKELSKAYLLKIMIHDIPKIPAEMEKTKTKEYTGGLEMELIGIRFQKFFKYEVHDPAEYESPTKKRVVGELEWVPRRLIPDTSNSLREFLMKQQEAENTALEKLSKKKNSPKKKNSRKSPSKGSADSVLDLDFLDYVQPKLSFDLSPTREKSVSVPVSKVSARTFFPVHAPDAPYRPSSKSPSPPPPTIPVLSAPTLASELLPPSPSEVDTDVSLMEITSFDAKTKPSGTIQEPPESAVTTDKGILSDSPSKILQTFSTSVLGSPRKQTRKTKKFASPKKARSGQDIQSPVKHDILELLKASPSKSSALKSSPLKSSPTNASPFRGSAVNGSPFEAGESNPSPLASSLASSPSRSPTKKFYKPLEFSPLKARRTNILSSPSKGNRTYENYDSPDKYALDKARKKLDFREIKENGNLVILLDSDPESDNDLSMINATQETILNSEHGDDLASLQVIGSSPKTKKLDPSTKKSLLENLLDDFDDDSNVSVSITELKCSPKTRIMSLQLKTSLLEDLENTFLDSEDEEDASPSVTMRSESPPKKLSQIPLLVPTQVSTIELPSSSPAPATTSASAQPNYILDKEQIDRRRKGNLLESRDGYTLQPERTTTLLDDIAAWSDSDIEHDSFVTSQPAID